MFHHIKRAVLLAWLGGIFLLILLALLISVTRILLPRLSAYRVELEQTASQYVGGQVHIQSMSVGLRGFHPEIVLQKVAIEPPFGKADFFLGEVRIGLDSKALLLQQQVHPLYMEFKQSRIRVKHRSDGSVVIDGLEEIGTHLETADHQSQPNWVVRISDSTLIWENQVINAAPVRANVEQLDLVIKGQHAQINADLQLAKQGGRIHLAADVQGRLGWANEWDARFFMQARNVQLKKFLAGRTGGTFNFADGESDFRLWSHWKSGKLQDISGELSLHSLLLENGRGDNLRQYQLEKMSSWLRWQRTLEGWRFDADELQIQHKGITEPASTISMVASYDEQGKLDVSGGLSRLRPHNLLEIFAVVPLPQEKWAQTLQAVKPQADISNMAFRVHMLEPRAQWYARADLKELALQDFENIPRIKGLSGHIVADQDKGLLSLNSHGLSLFPPRLFRQPLEAEQAQGEIRWWRDEQMAWQLDAAHIDLQTADIKTSSRFSLRLPQHADEAFFLDLQTAFGEGDATRVPDYLPVGIMSANVVDWLDQAFVKGRVLHGGVIVRGDLRKFPFSDSDGRFQVLLDVDDMNILYQPGWPLIKQVAAEIQFDAARLDVWVKQGQQYSSRIKQAHIWIDDMFEETPLRLKAQSQGPTQDVLRFLSESPLKSTFAYLTEGVQAEGRNASELELTVPLSGEAATVRGNTRFQSSSLHLQEEHIDMADIIGRLDFTEASVTGRDIECKLNAIPASLSVHTLKQGDGFELALQAELEAAEIQALLPENTPRVATGEAGFDLTLRVPHDPEDKGLPIRLALKSDLKGLALDLPQPFAKQKKQPRTLSVQAVLGKGQKLNDMRLQYADLIQVSLSKEDSIRVHFGKGRAEQSGQADIVLSGQLTVYNVAEWQSWMKRHVAESATSPSATLQADLLVDDLVLGDFSINQLGLKAHSDKQGIRGELFSESIRGQFEIPVKHRQKALKVKLEQVSLELDGPSQLGAVDESLRHSDEKQAWDPLLAPAMDVSIERLLINNKPLGSFHLKSRALKQGLRFEQIELDSKLVNIKGTGEWLKKPAGELYSSLDLNIATTDLGQAIKIFQYESGIEGGNGKLDLKLHWFDSINRVAIEKLLGSVSMDIRDGSVAEVDPGLGRILGLVNFASIGRRLKLDFTDALGKGLAFDRIWGEARFQDQQMIIENLHMAGPAVLVAITGRTGLAARDYDQNIEVTPLLKSTVSVAGAIAGGPVVGAALYAVQSVLGEDVGRFSRQKYHLTGIWAEPNFEKSTVSPWAKMEPGTGFSDDARADGTVEIPLFDLAE